MFVRGDRVQAGVLCHLRWPANHGLHLRFVWEIQMNPLLEKVKTMADGVKNLTAWVGSGGEVVAQDVAQERANICFKCPLNQRGMGITGEVAEATLRFLEFKNSLDLHVADEEKLHHCFNCGCVLKLLIFEPQDRVVAQMTDQEKSEAPEHCWKIKLP